MGVVRSINEKRASTPDTGPSVAALVAAAQDGQAWAQEALFRRYGRMAAGLAHRLLAAGDPDVDDLVQDAFITAFTKLHTLKVPEAFSSWLGSVVVRLATKRLRRRQLQRRLGLRRSEDFDFELVANPDAPADLNLELQQVYGLLGSLRPDERVALVLRRVDGLSIGEIASHMGLSLSTTKRRLRAAEARLDRVNERSARIASRQGDKDRREGKTP